MHRCSDGHRAVLGHGNNLPFAPPLLRTGAAFHRLVVSFSYYFLTQQMAGLGSPLDTCSECHVIAYFSKELWHSRILPNQGKQTIGNEYISLNRDKSVLPKGHPTCSVACKYHLQISCPNSPEKPSRNPQPSCVKVLPLCRRFAEDTLGLPAMC